MLTLHTLALFVAPFLFGALDGLNDRRHTFYYHFSFIFVALGCTLVAVSHPSFASFLERYQSSGFWLGVGSMGVLYMFGHIAGILLRKRFDPVPPKRSLDSFS